eukprot:TRINITY_DN5331_c1_g1_i8.p1 TRINITY_DN5331_c1_g1~~TRINITY_DN5331_c1_g1_i8.p1  ORF type:complete len:611 (-),score=109.06 TRINITY_DN5331_c1_g1_i8:103-1875(-)
MSAEVSSLQLTEDELTFLSTTLKEAVVSAVMESIPAEIRNVEITVRRAMCMLEAISTTVNAPGVIVPRTDTVNTIVESKRKTTEQSPSASCGLPNNLHQVREQLFLESMNPKRSPSKSRSSEEVIPRRSLSDSSVKEPEKPRSHSSSSGGQGGGQQLSCNEEPPSQVNSAAAAKRLEKRSLGSSGKNADIEFSNVGAISSSPGNPSRVVPCDDTAGQMSEKIMNRKTTSAASQTVQEKIIHTSCASLPRSATHDRSMPLAMLIIRSSFLCRMGLLLTVLLRAALIVTLSLKYSLPVDPLRDLPAFIFAIVAGVSSKQLAQAKQFIDHATSWAVKTASTGTWLTASQRKQRWLLVWWASTLLSMVVCQAVNFHRLMKFGHDDDLQAGCLWASEILTCLIYFVSITLLVPAAFLQCRIISALDVFIDVWSCDLCEHRDFADGVVTWNTVQALIRKAGASFANMFITIQVCALLGCMVLATQGITFVLQHDRSWLDITGTLPLLLLASLAGCLLLQCAWITDKCAILAPLINQISTAAMDEARQYLARYLTDSAAGIYVQGVRLDMMMVVNILYFLAVTAFGFFGVVLRLAKQ